MGRYSIGRSSSGNIYVPSDVKTMTHITVGGGGGGGYPNIPVFSGNFTSPQAGGYTCAGGVIAYGGGAGSLYSSGYGGSGNWRSGSSGRFGGGPWNRAASGYSSYGSGGSGQWRGSSSSYGGGGGGASCCTKNRGASGAAAGQYVYVRIGYGGTQGGSGNCRYGASGGYFGCVCTYDAPTPSISANPAAFRANKTDGNNGTTTLSWTIGGGDSDSEVLERLRNGAVVESYGQVNRTNNGFVVSPTETSEFRLTASNPAYSRSDSVTVNVYIEPVVTFSASSGNQDPGSNPPTYTIVQGTSIILSWTVLGDASSLIIAPGIGSSGFSSSTVVSPTVTTTYTATATGLGGTGSSSLLINVLEPPSINVSGPINVLYEENIPITITATNSDGGISYVAEYLYLDGTNEFRPSESIPNTSGDEVEVDPYTIPVVYNDFGPFKVRLVFTVDGYGSLTATDTIEVPIIIDQMPDAIDIPETDDTFKNEEPVVTPDVEVTTDQIVINDIDVPVEVKADYPVQIEIDDSGIFIDVREI